MKTSVIITLDMEWASDCIIEDIASLFIERGVKGTWFVTHQTAALSMLRSHDSLFELGIHPNFKEGSSHGRTMPEVVSHCLGLVPEAVSARSHGLIQSDYLWRYYAESTPIRYECSTFLGPVPCAYPSRFFWNRKDLLRIPFTYQDNIETDAPFPIWNANDFLAKKMGIQVLNFHPFHIYANASSMAAFEEVKKLGRPFHELSEEELLPYRRNGDGSRSMFVSALDYLAEHGGGIRVKDIMAFDAAGGQTA